MPEFPRLKIEIGQVKRNGGSGKRWRGDDKNNSELAKKNALKCIAYSKIWMNNRGKNEVRNDMYRICLFGNRPAPETNYN
jgi:hypothetical protein